MKLQQIAELLMQISYAPGTEYLVSITYNTYGSIVVFDSYAIIITTFENEYPFTSDIYCSNYHETKNVIWDLKGFGSFNGVQWDSNRIVTLDEFVKEYRKRYGDQFNKPNLEGFKSVREYCHSKYKGKVSCV